MQKEESNVKEKVIIEGEVQEVLGVKIGYLFIPNDPLSTTEKDTAYAVILNTFHKAFAFFTKREDAICLATELVCYMPDLQCKNPGEFAKTIGPLARWVRACSKDRAYTPWVTWMRKHFE